MRGSSSGASAGHESHDDCLAANDRIAGFEFDTLQSAGHGRGDDESLAHAGLALFVDRHLHGAALDMRHVDFQVSGHSAIARIAAMTRTTATSRACFQIAISSLLPHFQHGNQIEAIQLAPDDEPRHDRRSDNPETRPCDGLAEM